MGDELEHFKQFTKKEIEPELYEEVRLVLNDLQRNFSNGKKMEIKNRRYMALQKLIAEESYFSELEMMKRNPLLYDQLVGQYLSEKEKRERDSFTSCESITLVKILLETIDREDAESCRKRQEQEEIQIRSSDSDSDSSSEDCRAQDLISVSFDGARPSTSQWGEFESEQKPISSRKFKTPMITAEERLLLKQEFVTTMYQNFLDGKDKEFFDYSTVDTNSGYNNDGEMDHDAEDKYFDTEDVGNVEMLDEANADESSEDELDVYMKALNQHQSICDLAKDMKRNL